MPLSREERLAKKRAYNKLYYAAHRQDVIAGTKRWQENNRARRAAWAASYRRAKKPDLSAWYMARYHHPGTASREEYLCVWHAPCACCGIDPAGGVDRIDNGRPYDADNLQPMCWMCNRAKGKFAAAEFLWWRAEVALQAAKEAGLYKKHA